MKNVYLIRHAEKDDLGTLTESGRDTARLLANTLPKFVKIISSDSPRTQETAKLLTGVNPQVDSRAGFYMASKEKSDAINQLAKDKSISFLTAAKLYNDTEVNEGIKQKAQALLQLIDETLSNLNEGQSALIVSHDLCISPAMELKGVPLESIPFISGYVIDENFSITRFNR